MIPLNKKDSARQLWESAWNQRKCLACQGDWFSCFAYNSGIIWDFQIIEKRRARENILEKNRGIFSSKIFKHCILGYVN